MSFSEACPVYAPFFSGLGCTAAIVLSAIGASYATAKAGIGLVSAGVLRPDQTIKNLVPIVMASVVAIFGLIVGVLITGEHKPGLSLFSALTQLSAGLSMGLSGLAAGFAIGIVGDSGIRATTQQPRMYVAMVLILVFAEVLALYGLVIGLVMISKIALDPGC